MLWSLVQAMVRNMRFSSLLRTKLFLAQNIYWVLKENELDSREKCELKKVAAALDNRHHYTFSDIKLHRNLH